MIRIDNNRLKGLTPQDEAIGLYYLAHPEKSLRMVADELGIRKYQVEKIAIYCKREEDNTTNNLVEVDKKQTLEERMKAFGLSLAPFMTLYDKAMIRSFYNYWSEPQQNVKRNKKMRWELERTWSVKNRLITWKQRTIKEYGNTTSTSTTQQQEREQQVIDLVQKYI